MNARALGLWMIAFGLAAALTADPMPEIRDGDRVAFWGDSVTDKAYYPRTIENYYRGRFPRIKAEFFNLGWGGDTVASAKRMERDLPPLEPTLVFIALGMNDGEYAPFSERVADAFASGMGELVSLVRARTGARVILMTPTPYEAGVRADEAGKRLDGFYNDTLRRLSDRLMGFGRESGIPVIDVNAAFSAAVARAKVSDPGFRFTLDSIHPNAAGQAILAACVLAGLGADEKALELFIDAESGTVLKSRGQETRIASRSPGSFEIERNPLAIPVAAAGAPAGPGSSPPWNELPARNILRVSSLAAPFYVLTLEGDPKPLAAYSRAELAAGVDLGAAGLRLPEYALAGLIRSCVDEEQSARYVRWRALLAKGAKGPADASPYAPETAESAYLAYKADAIAAFLQSEGLACRPYRLRLSAAAAKDPGSRSPPPSARLAISGPGAERVSGAWAGFGKLARTSEDGEAVYSLDYEYAGTWWAGFTLTLAETRNGGCLDLSGYETLRLSYMGPAKGNSVSAGLKSSSGGAEAESEKVEIGPPSAEFDTVDIPLRNFRTEGFDLSSVSALTINVSGTPSGKGTLAVKKIAFLAGD
jgi:lysophospholipase L1-like esterase